MNDYLEPDWNDTNRVHNWKNYISDELKEIWQTWPPDIRRMVAESADAIAGREEWE